MTLNVNVEYLGKKADTKDMVDETKLLWKEQGNRVKDIKTMDLYYKPEDGMCYYVINSTYTGSFPVESK